MQVAELMAATLPPVPLVTGIAVLAFGLAPRLTVALAVTFAVIGYLLDTFGTMLDWPCDMCCGPGRCTECQSPRTPRGAGPGRLAGQGQPGPARELSMCAATERIPSDGTAGH